MKMRYKNRLFLKVFTLIFISIIIVFTVFGFYSFFDKKNSLLKILNIEAQNVAKSIALVGTDALVTNDNTFLFEFNFEYIKQNDHVKNIIISKKDTSYLIIEKEKWLFTDKLDSILLSKQKKENTNDILISPILNYEVYHYTYPIYLSGLPWGWIHVSLGIDGYQEDIKNLYIEYILLFIAILFVSFFCSYLIAMLFSKPILYLNSIAKEISSGDLSKRVSVNRNDEIGELSNTFNTMVENLEKSKVELTTMNTKLEFKVIERTYELKSANNKLEELNNSLDVRIKNEINKRKEQEQILIQQSRLAAMGEMISMIAHQWRQPLSALGIIIQNIELSYSIGKLEKHFLAKQIEKSNALTQKMSTTIDDFKDFFKPNKIKLSFCLKEIVNQTYELIGESFVNNNITVNIDVEEDVRVYGFKNELSQVILNILTNAKDALLENKTEDAKIEFYIKKNKEFGQIIIRDNAGGIISENINKIYEPYFSTKEEKNGTGLGLYMSKIIIEQNMKGKLTVKNKNGGAQFCILIPMNN